MKRDENGHPSCLDYFKLTLLFVFSRTLCLLWFYELFLRLLLLIIFMMGGNQIYRWSLKNQCKKKENLKNIQLLSFQIQIQTILNSLNLCLLWKLMNNFFQLVSFLYKVILYRWKIKQKQFVQGRILILRIFHKYLKYLHLPTNLIQLLLDFICKTLQRYHFINFLELKGEFLLKIHSLNY